MDASIFTQGEIIVGLGTLFVLGLLGFARHETKIAQLKDDQSDSKAAVRHLNTKIGQVESTVNGVEKLMFKDIAELKALFLERFADLKVQISELKRENKGGDQQ